MFRPGHTVSLAMGAVDGERWCVLSPVLEGFARAREPRARRGCAAPSGSTECAHGGVWPVCGVHGLLERVYLGRPGLFRPGRTVSLAKGAVDGERWCVLCPVLEGFARAREPRSRRGRAAPSARRAVFGLCVVSQGCCVLERGYAVLALYGRQGSGRRGERPHAVCVVVFARVLRKSPRAERAPRQPSLCTRACGAWSPVSGWRRNGVECCMAHARAVTCVVVRCMGGGCCRPSAHTLIVWMGQARLS